MTDSTVAVQKPGKAKTGSSKTLLAGLVVVLLLAAFAAAFYTLGGSDLLAGLVSGLFTAPAPAATPPQGSKPAAAAPATSTASALQLPPGVDEPFAVRMYEEQLESEENIGKLVTGKVASFTLGTPATVADGTEVPVTVKFVDGTSASGTLGLAQRQGNWFFVFIRGERGTDTKGEADSVAAGTDDGFTTTSTAGVADVDKDVLDTILSEQMKSQDVLKGIADGTYTAMSIDGVTQGPGTATLDVTLTGPKTAAMKGRVLCISKDIDGTRTWFVTSFGKA